MRGVEKIYHLRNLVAIVFRKHLSIADGVQFFTDNDNPFQVGVHKRRENTKLTPHVHIIKKPLVINKIQELLLVQDGKVRVTLYTKDGYVIGRKVLTSGEGILLLDEGHGVDFLQNSQIFEVKQGPYQGTVHAKIFLK